MPDQAARAQESIFLQMLGRHQRQLRLAALALAILGGAATGALLTIALVAAGFGRVSVMALAGVAGIAATLFLWRAAWTRWQPHKVALAVDRSGALDNLVVTAEELLRRRERPLRSPVEVEVVRQACDRLHAHQPGHVAPLRLRAALAAVAVAAFAVLLASLPARGPEVSTTAPTPARSVAALVPGELRVVVTPPAYVRREPVTAVNPTTVAALEGSRIRLEMGSAQRPPVLLGPAGDRVAFDAVPGAFVHDFTAADSRALVVRQDAISQGEARDHLLYIAVQPDARPVVTISAPAKDLRFGDASGNVPVEIEARDDLVLSALTLHFTRVSGSGEGFTFKEGSLPVDIARPAAGEWKGRATIALGTLGLEEGDTLVYQATARDQKPGAAASVSESFLIEIGKASGVASTGFALPDDRERQGLSQQMVIVKTERLHAQRSALAAEAFAEQAKLLGIEQRMVRSEFVFMTGGEVEDEVEEAGAAHELTEGRLENRGQSELLAAVREMSRAEARLNAADTAAALTFERAALRALQRAFDRRRYLLRTTPERARIDLERRLHGDLSAARSFVQDHRQPAEDTVVSRGRAAMLELSTHDVSQPFDSALAAQLLGVAPASEALRTAALRLSSAQNPQARAEAALAAGAALESLMRERLAEASRDRIPADPLRGRFADAWSRAPR